VTPRGGSDTKGAMKLGFEIGENCLECWESGDSENFINRSQYASVTTHTYLKIFYFN